MKKLILASLAFAALSASAQQPTALVQPGYTLDCQYTVANISNGQSSRSGVGIHDKFFVNYHATGIKVYGQDGSQITTIAPTTGYYNWVNCNVDAAGNLLAQLDVKAFDGAPSANGSHGFMVINTIDNSVAKNYLKIDGGFPTRNDAMAPVAKDILTGTDVHVFSVRSGNDNTYINTYDAGAYNGVAAFTTKNTDLFPAAYQNQTTTGYVMEYKDLDASLNLATYVNVQYEATYSAAGKYGNGIQKFNASGSTYAPANEYFYTPMHSGLTAFNIFNLGGKQYIVYPARNPNADPAADNRPADAFAIAEISFLSSPATDMTMEGETLVNGLPAGKLVAIFPGVAGAGDTSCTPSYTIEAVEGDENSVYIYMFNSGANGYKWKFTVPESGVVTPGNNAVYSGMVNGTYTQTMTDQEPVEYPYSLVYSIRYNLDRTLTLTSKYYWTEGTPVGAEGFSYIMVNGAEMQANPIGTAVTTEATFNYDDQAAVHFKLPVALGAVECDVTYTVGTAQALTVQPSQEAIITQADYKLTNMYTTPAVLATNGVSRSGVGINDKFFVNEHATGIKVYDSEGNLLNTIAPTEGYHNWVSCNVDGAGHLLAQLDVKAFDGNCSIYPNHGFMIIDTETGAVLKDYLPMGNETPSALLGEVASRRYDSMAPVLKDIMTESNVRIITPYNAMRAANQNSYNNTAEAADTYPAYWKFAEFLANETVANTSTAYAMEYWSFTDATKTEMALYHAPDYNTKYSAQGLAGNSIRRCTGNWTLTGEYFYTPMHSGLTGYNMFDLAGKHYIIYPARSTTGADTKDNRPADAFAIAEVSFVDTPTTDMNMEGEVLIGGQPAGTLKALFQGSTGVAAGATSCTPSYTIEAIPGQDNSVFIYVYNADAPAAKWRFTVGEEQPLPEPEPDYAITLTADVDELTDTSVSIEYSYTMSEDLETANPTVVVKMDGVAIEDNPFVITDLEPETDYTYTFVAEATVGETTVASEPVVVSFTTAKSGIAGVAAEQSPVEYFNLQGVRVANPENGVYIRRQGSKVTKVTKF